MGDPTSFALKKVLPNNATDLEHFLSTFATDLLMTQAFAYDGSSQTEYIGFALPGTSKASPRWLIKKLTYSAGLVTDIQFAGGVVAFNSIWNNRTSLSYS